MRGPLVTLALASLLRVCGSEPEAPPPVGAAPPAPAASALAMNAMHGGSVILVEDQWVEVVPKADGAIEAYLLGPSASPAVAASTNLAVKVSGDDGREHDVVMAWSPATSRYEGRLVEARPAPGPVEVTVIAPGRPPRRARAPRVVVVTAPPPSPTIVVQPRPVAPGVVVVAPAPAPGVVVVAPPAPQPHGVVVLPPAPPGPAVVVVEGRDHPGRGHAHGHDRRGTVVVGPAPHHPPGVVVVAPSPHPRGVVVVPAPHHPPGVVVRPGRGHGGHGGHGGRGRH